MESTHAQEASADMRRAVGDAAAAAAASCAPGMQPARSSSLPLHRQQHAAACSCLGTRGSPMERRRSAPLSQPPPQQQQQLPKELPDVHMHEDLQPVDADVRMLMQANAAAAPVSPNSGSRLDAAQSNAAEHADSTPKGKLQAGAEDDGEAATEAAPEGHPVAAAVPPSHTITAALVNSAGTGHPAADDQETTRIDGSAIHDQSAAGSQPPTHIETHVPKLPASPSS